MIYIVVPTIVERVGIFSAFMRNWQPLFDKHNARFIKVLDGDEPTVDGISAKEVMGKYADCLTNHNGGIRNLGFAYVAKQKDAEYIITLDDDEAPIGDPIQDHIDALNMQVPISWMSTASEYMRGFPYAVREEAEVVLSHGVWEGVADFDAPTQLVQGVHPVEFPKMPIPKGIYFPMCAMNLAFKPCMLPWVFQAPWVLGINRYDDIAAGIVSKREIDKNGWAAVTGYARVNHQRASNTFTNLKHEAPGIEINETFWQGNEDHPWFAIYREKLALWQQYLQSLQ